MQKLSNTEIQLLSHIQKSKFPCREFDANEAILILTYNPSVYWSWGVTKIIRQKNTLTLKVNGKFFKHYVVITLGGDDTFSIRYVYKSKGEFKVKHEVHGIYFDELLQVIDNYIETFGK